MSSVAKAKRPMSAGRAKKVAKNSLVHIILGILAVVWLFPIFWIIMTSFRAESGAYTSTSSHMALHLATIQGCSQRLHC